MDHLPADMTPYRSATFGASRWIKLDKMLLYNGISWHAAPIPDMRLPERFTVHTAEIAVTGMVTLLKQDQVNLSWITPV
jgi:hypothetical protein